MATVQPTTPEAALENAIKAINKKYGDGSIMFLGRGECVSIPVITTGCLSIDAALGVGGVPRGRIVEIYGPESSGKTTLALHLVAEAQKAGGMVAFIDAEHALDQAYAEKLGVKTENLLICQPDSGEQALQITESLVKTNAVNLIVIDSVAALVPSAELDGEMGDSLPGLQARLMSQALRKMTALISNSNTCVLFINQVREKIGVYGHGPNETTTGGRALRFYASQRIDIRRIGTLKDGDKPFGSRTKVKVVKNKVAPPFKETEVDIIYGEGISRIGDILDQGVLHKLIQKNGTWFSLGEHRLGQGRDMAKQTLQDNPEILSNLELDLRSALGLGNGKPAPDMALS